MKPLYYSFGLILLVLLAQRGVAGTIYKTLKSDGTVIYSDVPQKGSVEVTLGQVNGATVPALADPDGLNQGEIAVKASNTKYQIRFLSPAQGETIRNNAGDVQVSFVISPDYPGKFELLLDNQVVNTKGKMQFTLENVLRGEHKLEVNLRDKSGKIFASSGQQTFYLHKASALIHAN